MKESILDHKKLLIVDDEQDILAVVEGEISESCPNSTIDKATSYEEATGLLKSKEYDLVLLDIMGVRGFDLLETAVRRGFKVAMLTAHSLSPEALKRSHDMGASSYLPKDKLGELVPFLEDVLKDDFVTGWKRLLDKLEPDFDKTLGHNWKTNAGIKYWY
jgi:DNA-binding response OmpR family regulator